MIDMKNVGRKKEA